MGVALETLTLLQQLPNLRMLKGSRNGNEVAHSLARLCREESSSGVLLSSILPCMEAAVQHDCKDIICYYSIQHHTKIISYQLPNKVILRVPFN